MSDSSKPYVLILGAQGFIGTHLRKRLCGDYSLLCVDIQPPRALSAQTGSGSLACEEYLFHYDLGDPEQIQELVDEIGQERLGQTAAVIHLAAYYDFLNKPDLRYERLQSSMQSMLAMIEHHIPDEAPLIYASSMAAMAPTEPGKKLTPESPRLGAWAYPKHKIASEKLLEGSGLSNPIVELVLSGVYSDMCELVPLFQQIERIREGSIELYFYPGKTDRGLTYVHVEDCVEAFTLAIPALRGKAGVHRLLIGEPEPMTYREIHDAASQSFWAKRLPLLPMPKVLAQLGAWGLGGVARVFGRRRFIQPWMVQFAGEHFEFDISQTTEVLGWVPKHRLSKRMGRILSLAKNHPTLWKQINDARPW